MFRNICVHTIIACLIQSRQCMLSNWHQTTCPPDYSGHHCRTECTEHYLNIIGLCRACQTSKQQTLTKRYTVHIELRHSLNDELIGGQNRIGRAHDQQGQTKEQIIGQIATENIRKVGVFEHFEFRCFTTLEIGWKLWLGVRRIWVLRGSR